MSPSCTVGSAFSIPVSLSVFVSGGTASTVTVTVSAVYTGVSGAKLTVSSSANVSNVVMVTVGGDRESSMTLTVTVSTVTMTAEVEDTEMSGVKVSWYFPAASVTSSSATEGRVEENRAEWGRMGSDELI